MDVASLICVHPPYFALQQISAGPTGATATVPVEQDLGFEQGPISAAEAGRHLAVLGCCALASAGARREPHYYLPTCAELERLAPGDRSSGALRAEARGWFTAEGAGRAQCTLLAAGTPLYTLDVSFTVLDAAAFQRLFAHARRTSECQVTSNPHARRPELGNLSVRGRRAACLLPPLDAELCAGHFLDFPVLPVASVIRHLSDLAGELYSCLCDHSPSTYVVRRARASALQPVLPREQVLLEVENSGSLPDGSQTFACRATATAGKIVGEVELVLSARPSAQAHAESAELSAS